MATSDITFDDFHNIWQPLVSLDEALAHSRKLVEDKTRHDLFLSIVFLRFLPLVNHRAAARRGKQTLHDDPAFLNLLETIDLQLADAEALCPCVNTICTLSTQYKTVPLLLQADCHNVIAKVVERQPDHEGLIQMCMATISNLALHKSSAPELIKDIPALAMDAIHRHTEPSLVECAVTFFANLANTRNKSIVQGLLDCDSHLCCQRLLSSEEKGIRYHSALCLANLGVSPLTHDQLLAHDIHDNMITVLIRDMDHPPLVENVLGYLARLTQAGFVEDVMTLEAMEHLLSALAQHPTRPSLQTYGCVVLLSYVAVLPTDTLKSEAMALFKRRRAEFNPAFVAALTRSDEHVANAYIRLVGMDPDRKHAFNGRDRLTPLVYATQKGAMEVVKTLLSNHAAPLADNELTTLACQAMKLTDADLRFRQLLCLGLIKARKQDLDAVPLDKTKGLERLRKKKPTLMRPIPVEDVKPEAVIDCRSVPEENKITTIFALKQYLRDATPISRTTALANKIKARQPQPNWFDRALDRFDRWLLALVFDARDGRLLVCRAIMLVVGSSLFAGLVVGVALIMATGFDEFD
eukprot:TRINITY_DN12302_c1_g1_i1.p1 TRINITY_DN12302_c1_g1~~TRINITY_DN12302_c1_g1_i1.p1  ORF type:complete len:579 (+),score=110.47 TRINITY_DN12302_c1_g1_i1:1767-3503(+)